MSRYCTVFVYILCNLPTFKIFTSPITQLKETAEEVVKTNEEVFRDREYQVKFDVHN